jgi:hypothetical protein
MANEFKIGSKLVIASTQPILLPKRSADPVSGMVSGDFYYNTTNNEIKYYNGTAWQLVASGVVSLTGQSLNNNHVIVGNVSNQSASVDTSATGDILASSADGLNLKAGVVDNAAVGAAANIARSKLASGTANTLVYNNGTGVMSDLTAITASRALVSDINGLPVASTVTTTELQYVSGVTSSIQTQLDGKLSLSGGTMTGNIAMGGNKITGLGAPTAANDAARKVDIDTALAGLDFQADVLDIQIDNTLVPSLVTGSRYIVTDVGNLNAGFGTITGVGNNDIVQYDGANFVVSYDVSAQGEGALVWNRADDTFYYYTTAWASFGGLTGVTAGIGLLKTGNTLDVNLGAGITQLPTDEVGIDLFSASGLHLTVDGTTDSTATGAQLSLKLDGATLSKTASGVKVADGGISNTQVASNAAIALTKLAAVTANRAIVSDASGFLIASATTDTEIGYLSGVTSAIQTQLNNKASTTLNNLGTTSINADLLPSADVTRSLGASGNAFLHTHTQDITLGLDDVNTPNAGTFIGKDGSGNSIIEFFGGAEVDFNIGRSTDATRVDLDIRTVTTTADNSGSIFLITGSTTAPADRGDVNLVGKYVNLNGVTDGVRINGSSGSRMFHQADTVPANTTTFTTFFSFTPIDGGASVKYSARNVSTNEIRTGNLLIAKGPTVVGWNDTFVSSAALMDTDLEFDIVDNAGVVEIKAKNNNTTQDISIRILRVEA